MRLSGADAPVYVEPGASVAGERGDVLGELGAVGLGKEDATEWSVGTVFSVLDARYEDMRPTIVTSNYAPGALADRLARRGERVTAEAIASRISQTCRPVYLGGRDRRRLG